MSIVDDVNAAIADAMRKHDPARLSALRMLKAALMNRDVEKGRALDDAEARQVVTSLVKQRKDSVEQFTKAGRQDLAGRSCQAEARGGWSCLSCRPDAGLERRSTERSPVREGSAGRCRR